MSKVLEALGKMDPMNDNHWTSDGMPRIDTVKFLAGDPTLTREMVTAEAPNFTRQGLLAMQATAGATPPVVTEQATPAVAAAAAPVVTEQAAAPVTIAQPVERVVDYDAAIEAAQRMLQDAITARNEANDKVAEVQNALDDLINAKHAAGESESTMDVIQGYLRSQAGVLQERARRAQVLKESGVTLEDIKNLIPQASPLDQALARKR